MNRLWAARWVRSFGEVKGNIALLPIAAGWSTYVSGCAKFNNQFTTWTARGGVGCSW